MHYIHVCHMCVCGGGGERIHIMAAPCRFCIEHCIMMLYFLYNAFITFSPLSFLHILIVPQSMMFGPTCSGKTNYYMCLRASINQIPVRPEASDENRKNNSYPRHVLFRNFFSL